MGGFRKVRPIVQSALTLAVLEPDHPDVVTLRNNLEEGPTRTRSLGSRDHYARVFEDDKSINAGQRAFSAGM
jgi:hypothetical protein